MSNSGDALKALIDLVEIQALSIGPVEGISFASLYRFFLSVYDHDLIATREAFVQFMEGEIPSAVLAYCQLAMAEKVLKPSLSTD